MSKLLKATGLMSIIFKPLKVQKHARIKIYNTLSLLMLIYGSENWTMKSNDKTRIKVAEMKFMRRIDKYTWMNYKRNKTY
jgi:hypothetical protein